MAQEVDPCMKTSTPVACPAFLVVVLCARHRLSEQKRQAKRQSHRSSSNELESFKDAPTFSTAEPAERFGPRAGLGAREHTPHRARFRPSFMRPVSAPTRHAPDEPR